MGFEPMTSSLPRKCSTPELRRLIFWSQMPCSDATQNRILFHPFIALLSSDSKHRIGYHLSGRRGSNSRPIAWKAIALPTELLPPGCFNEWIGEWLNEWIINTLTHPPTHSFANSLPCGERRIRTFVARATDLQSVPFDRSGISPLFKFESRNVDCGSFHSEFDISHSALNRASYRDRTNDLLITSQLLYQLS